MLYQIFPVSKSEEALVYYENYNHIFPDKYRDYFVHNKGDGKFLNYTTLAFCTQEAYNQNNIVKEDFLDCITAPMPIFSVRFVNILNDYFVDEMKFIKCDIKCENKIFEYYIGKILKTKILIDRDNSTYRQLSDGSKIIDKPCYNINMNTDDFFIARDIDHYHPFFVTDKFIDLVKKNKLKMRFKEANWYL